MDFSCPGCGKVKRVDVSRFLESKKEVRLTYRFRCEECDCGHKDCSECLKGTCSQGYVNTVLLERRGSVRKDTLFSGTLKVGGRTLLPIEVLDISRIGVRIRVTPPARLVGGERVVLDCQLDDRKQTRINKDGTVEWVNGYLAGIRFSESDTYSATDKAIGFYLME